VAFHTDFSRRTMQVALNDDADYEGAPPRPRNRKPASKTKVSCLQARRLRYDQIGTEE
jgi:hypothetical protein